MVVPKEGGAVSYERGTPVWTRVNSTGALIPEEARLSYRGTSLTRKRTPLGCHHRPMPRVLGGSQGGGRSLTVEVPLHETDQRVLVDYTTCMYRGTSLLRNRPPLQDHLRFLGKGLL